MIQVTVHAASVVLASVASKVESKGANWRRLGLEDNTCKAVGSDGHCKNA